LQTLTTGLSSSNNDEDTAGGYMGQLADAKAQLAAAGTEAEQAKVKIAMTEKEIKEKEPRAKKAEKEGEGLIREFEQKKADVERLTKRLQGSGWDEKKEKELLQKQAYHSEQMNGLMEVSLGLAYFESVLIAAPRHDQVPPRRSRLLVFRPIPQFRPIPGQGPRCHAYRSRQGEPQELDGAGDLRRRQAVQRGRAG